MTGQETFEKVVRALALQGRASVDDLGSCVYRGPEGTRCAAGHLIADEDYDPSMEGIPIDDLITKEPDIQSFLAMQPVAHLVVDLQNVHDDDAVWESRRAFVSAFGRIGRRHVLDTGFMASLEFGEPLVKLAY